MKLKKNIIILIIIIVFSFKPANSIADVPVLDQIRDITSNSIGILIMSVIGTIYSGILYNGAAKQEKESQANIDKLDKLIAELQNSFVNFCPNGRESLTEPKCYCYLESGKQNLNRTNSQTCKDLWTKNTYKITATPGDYSDPSKFTDAVGCVNKNNTFDPQCTCRNFTDSAGKNSCMKIDNINIPAAMGPAFATNSGLQDVTTLAKNSVNGNPKLGSMNINQANAIKAKKLAQDIFAKVAPKLPPKTANILKANDKNINALTSSVLGQKAMQAAMNTGSPSALGMASSRDSDEKMSGLLKQAEKNAGLTETVGNGLGLSNKKANGKDGINLNSMGDNSSIAPVQNFAEKGKNYNYKNNDISKKDGISIFQIISNRYIQSGLRRLFDDSL